MSVLRDRRFMAVVTQHGFSLVGPLGQGLFVAAKWLQSVRNGSVGHRKEETPLPATCGG